MTGASPSGPVQTAIGIERATAGVSQQTRQAKFAALEEVLKSKKGMAALREYMVAIQQEHVLDFLEDVRRYRWVEWREKCRVGRAVGAVQTGRTMD